MSDLSDRLPVIAPARPLGRASALAQRLPSALILFALIGMPFVLWPGMMYSYWQLKRTFAEALGFLLAGAVVFRALLASQVRVQLGGIELAALAYALFVLAGFAFFPGYQGFATKAGVLFGLTLVAVVLAHEVAREGESLAEKVVTCLWASGILVSIHCVLQIFGVDPLLEVRFGFFAKTNIFGPLGNPNVCGGFLCAVYPFALLKVQRRRDVLTVGALVLLVVTALFTESRGAWTGMALATFVFFSAPFGRLFLALRKRPAMFVGVLLSSAGVIVAGAFALFGLNPESSLSRVAIWRIAWLMFLDSPLVGIGFRSIPSTYPLYQARLFAQPGGEGYLDFAAFNTHAHNDVLEVLAETGLLGLGLFALLVFVVLRTGLRLVRASPGPMRGLVLALIASPVAVLMHGMVDCPLYAPPIHLVFLAAAGVLAGLLHRSGGPTSLVAFDAHLSLPRWSRVAVVLGAAAVLVFQGQRLAHNVAGYVHWKNGDLLLTAEDSTTQLLIRLALRPDNAAPPDEARRQKLEPALVEYQKAVEALPERGVLRLQTALVLAELNQPVPALEQLRLAVLTHPDWEVYSALGLLIERFGGDLARAEAHQRQALAINPRLLLPRYLLARAYIKSNQPARAAQLLDEARQVSAKAGSAQVKAMRAAIEDLSASLAAP